MHAAIGQTHVQGWVAATVGAVFALILLAYWLRLGEDDVPPSRRYIRRVSAGIMFVTTGVLVMALGFINYQSQPTAYVVAWGVVVLLVTMMFITALLDLLNNARLNRDRLHDQVIEATADAMRIKLERQKQAEASNQDTSDEDRSS